MNIQAKMNCQSVTRTSYRPGGVDEKVFQERVILTAVSYGDSDENKSFSEATPDAKLDILISNQSALGAFEPGEDYYINFAAAKLLD